MERKHTQKGITLIALIITIIVLLILAVVAIGAIQNDGIINHAKNARTEYEAAQANEQGFLDEYEGYLENVNTPVGGGEEASGPWTQSATVLTHSETGQTINVGDTVDYTVSGYTGTWKVLGAEDGQILLMTTADVQSNYSLSGKADYLGGVEKLNGVCAGLDAGNYAVSGSARSITVDDIDRITGFDKTTYGEGEVYQYGNKVTYTLAADGDTISWTVEGKPDITGSCSLFDDVGTDQFLKYEDGTALAAGESYTMPDESTYYYYSGSSLGTTSQAYKMLFRNAADTSNCYYWLASPYVYASEGCAHWGLRFVGSGSVNGYYLWGSDYGVGDNSGGVRAVVSLESDVTLTSSGTNAWALPTT